MFLVVVAEMSSLEEIFAHRQLKDRFTQYQLEALHAGRQAGMTYKELAEIAHSHPDSVKHRLRKYQAVPGTPVLPNIKILKTRTPDTIDILNKLAVNLTPFSKFPRNGSGFSAGAWMARLVFMITDTHQLPTIEDWMDFRQGWLMTQSVLQQERKASGQ